jgi:hypothetical protein
MNGRPTRSPNGTTDQNRPELRRSWNNIFVTKLHSPNGWATRHKGQTSETINNRRERVGLASVLVELSSGQRENSSRLSKLLHFDKGDSFSWVVIDRL